MGDHQVFLDLETSEGIFKHPFLVKELRFSKALPMRVGDTIFRVRFTERNITFYGATTKRLNKK